MRAAILLAGAVAFATVFLDQAHAEDIAFTEDSGTADSPIIYRARRGETVHLSGGRVVTGWKPVTDPAVVGRFDPAARGKVFQADLRAGRDGKCHDELSRPAGAIWFLAKP